jgi:transposase
LIKELYEENLLLKEENRLLREENEILKKRVKELELQVERQEERIKILESRLNRDSHNSSKPPSSDGFKKIKSLRQPSGKSPGGRLPFRRGHKGHTLEMVDNPDYQETHRVEVCNNCKHSLIAQLTRDYEKRQVLDIPPLKLESTEHLAEVKYCPICGQKNKASFPADVTSPIQYGNNFKSLLIYLSAYQLIPFARVCEFASDLFSQTISSGALNNILGNCYNSLERFDNTVKDEIIKSPVVHFDETGIKSIGNCTWLHSASTKYLTYYSPKDKRGTEGIDAVGILPNFVGIAVHDGWKSYPNYPCAHSLCNAHHLRELNWAIENPKVNWASKMKEHLLKIKEVVDNAKSEGLSSLDSNEIAGLKNTCNEILNEGLKEYPQTCISEKPKKRGCKKQDKDKNLFDRLRTHSNEVLRFMTDFNAPFDNNLAERDIRMTKLKMKISGTFRSDQGAKFFCK